MTATEGPRHGVPIAHDRERHLDVNSVAARAEPSLRRAAARFRFALCVATAVMLTMSWPLWVAPSRLPRVPCFRRLGLEPSAAVSWVTFALVVVLLALAAAGIRVRDALVVASVLLVARILPDQNRFQPWAYQFLVQAVLLATLTAPRALAWSRIWMISMYLHAGLSKLDYSFVHGSGPMFLRAALLPFASDPDVWPEPLKLAAVLAFPAFELAAGLMLAFRGTRRFGLAAAVGMHAALAALLGPWALDHSAIVVVWNLALIVQDVILFTTRHEPGDLWSREPFDGKLAIAGVCALVILPLGERYGLLDPWPSHALYANHVARVEIEFIAPPAEPASTDFLLNAAPELAGFVRPNAELDALRLDLNAWSRAARGTPIYPGGRAALGLAEALAARYRRRLDVRVVVEGPANRWTGARARTVAVGANAIRKLADRFRLNTRPAHVATKPAARAAL